MLFLGPREATAALRAKRASFVQGTAQAGGRHLEPQSPERERRRANAPPYSPEKLAEVALSGREREDVAATNFSAAPHGATFRPECPAPGPAWLASARMFSIMGG
jgi:hypothetical protein